MDDDRRLDVGDHVAVERVVEPRSARDVPFYRRPFAEMIDPLLEAGFRPDRITDPRPTEAFAKNRPDRYEELPKRPTFLRLRAVR